MISTKYPFLADLDVDNLVIHKLTLNLDNIVRGNDHVLVTPLGKAVAPDVILREFDAIFNSPGNLSTMNKPLLELESSNKDKYGPRSIQKPWSERRASVLDYFESDRLIDQTLNYEIQNSKDKQTLRPIPRDKALGFLKNNTLSGLPFYTSKGSAKEFLRKDFDYYFDRDDPSVLLTRTQEKGKTRNVWCECVALALFEMMYYRPLLEYQRKLSWRSALVGPEEVDRHVTDLVNQALLRDLFLASLDYERFDASCKSYIQNGSFGYVKSLYQRNSWRDIDIIASRFNKSGIITPDGVMKGPHGIPSGSVFTNEIGSVSQMLIARQSKLVFPENMQVQGDDGVSLVKNDNVSSFFAQFTKYGLTVNKSKSIISKQYCTYLQKLYDADYRKEDGIIGGIYPVYRALNRLVYQERWSNFEEYGMDGKDYYSIRAITILENCKNHPLFGSLVKFIHGLDKYNLNYSQNGLNKYVSMLTESKGLEGLMVNQYGDNLKGISNFETVKLLRSLKA
nr:MAG: RNA-dependent RNA polymerase [Chemarfal virus 60]